jgi:hypothetical protein
MKSDALKKLIKEAVKEAIQEELKEILLEAVRAPKQVVTENVQPAARPAAAPTQTGPSVREKYSSLLDGMAQSRNGNLNMTSANAQGFGAGPAYRPPASANTAGEGSALPPGEVSLDQVMGMIKK